MAVIAMALMAMMQLMENERSSRNQCVSGIMADNGNDNWCDQPNVDW